MASTRSVHTTAKNLFVNSPMVTKRSSPWRGDGYVNTGRPSNSLVASIRSRPWSARLIARFFSSHSESIDLCIHNYVHSQEN